MHAIPIKITKLKHVIQIPHQRTFHYFQRQQESFQMMFIDNRYTR